MTKLNKSSKLWSSTKDLNSTENAFEHWNKHWSDFPDINNSIEYVDFAKNFLNNPPAWTLSKVRTWNNDIIFYNESSNIFGVKTADWIPRTVFKPNIEKHWHNTNLDYFNFLK